MPSDFDLAYQELIDSGLSEDEAAVKAREFTTPATDTTLLGNFIGDPADLASNTFREDVRPNGISSWTPAPVQPAGMAFNAPGDRWSDLATEYGNAGYTPEDVSKTITEPAQLVAAGINRVEGAYNVPEQTVSELKSKGEAAIERRIKLVQAGLGDAEADAVTLVPWMNQANEVAAQHRRSSAASNLRPLKMQDGGWSSFNPITGEVTPLIEGVEQIPKMYQAGLNSAIKAWSDASSGLFGDPNSANAQGVITNSFNTIQAIKKKIAELSNNPVPAGVSNRTSSPLKIGRFTVIPQ